MFLPVIMAGGSGTRLWPLSRQLNPKQFLPLVDADLTMLQATIKRLDGLEHGLPIQQTLVEKRFAKSESAGLGNHRFVEIEERCGAHWAVR